MNIRYRFVRGAAAVVAASLLSACSGMNRVDTRMDIVNSHLDAPGPKTYQGQVRVARRIGDMTALEFADGRYFDVADAPPALYPGDVVRIYQTDKGYVAHLWRPVDSTAHTHIETNSYGG